MKVICAYCGQRDNKSTMIVSRHTGRAWCRDEDSCRVRQGKKLKETKK